MMNYKRSKAKPSDNKLTGLYDLGETIGKGHYAIVKKAKHCIFGAKVAVKVIDKTKLDEISRAHLFQEVRCMQLVQHPNVVRLYEVIDTQTKLFLVLELGDGGDLYDYVSRHENGLEEAMARKYFVQIAEAINYCHQLHVVHRDLKLENMVLFDDHDIVKLTDFGFSNKFVPGRMLETSCGSLAYSAPEILLGDSYHAPAVDVWSLGVILFMLVTGKPPFNEANDSETLIKIMDAHYTLPGHLSQLCQNLIQRMLVRDPKTRISLEEVMSHPWMKSPDGVVQFPGRRPLVSTCKLSEMERNFVMHHIVAANIASKDDIIKSLENNPYDHTSATYYLLAEKFLRKRAQRMKDELTSSGGGGSGETSPVSAPPPLDSPKSKTNDPFSMMDGYREDLEKQKLLSNERVLGCPDNLFGYPYFKKRSTLGELTEDEDEEMEVDPDLGADRMASEKLLPDPVTKKSSSSSIFGTRNNPFLRQICEESSEGDESQCSSMTRNNHRLSRPSLGSSDFVAKTTPPPKPLWKRSLACNRSGSDTSDCDDVSSSSLGHHHRRRERRSVHRSTSLTSHGGHNRFANDPTQPGHFHHQNSHNHVVAHHREQHSPLANSGGSDPSALHSHLWSTFASRKLDVGDCNGSRPKFFLHDPDDFSHQQHQQQQPHHQQQNCEDKKQLDSNGSNVISKTLRRGSAAVIGTVKKSMSLILGRPSIVSDSNLHRESNESKTSCWGSCSDLLPAPGCGKAKSSNPPRQANSRFLDDRKLLSLTNDVRLGKSEILKEFVDCESRRKGGRSRSLVVHLRSKDFSALVDKFGGVKPLEDEAEVEEEDEGDATRRLNSDGRAEEGDDDSESQNLDGEVKMYCCSQKSKCCSVI